MELKIEVARKEDGRWIAGVPVLPGCLAYGETQADAQAKAKVLAGRMMAHCGE